MFTVLNGIIMDTETKNYGKIIHSIMEVSEGNGTIEVTEFISVIQGYNEKERKYTLDDINVISSTDGDYDCVFDYKMHENDIDQIFDSIDDIKRTHPHYLL